LIYIGVGWLVAFRIVNPWQPIVRMITDVLARIHEPLLSQVRRFLPDLGPVDISPIVLFLAAQFIRNLLISSLSG
jgi:YggT family protein